MDYTDFEQATSHHLADSIMYVSGSVLTKPVMRQKTGTVTLYSFDEGQIQCTICQSFERLIQIIDGEATITIKGLYNVIKSGQMIIIPANEKHSLKANTRFKMLSTIIMTSGKKCATDKQATGLTMEEIEVTKFSAGQTVYTKVAPKVKMRIRRYYKQIYYCKFGDNPERKELALFEREIQS